MDTVSFNQSINQPVGFSLNPFRFKCKTFVFYFLTKKRKKRHLLGGQRLENDREREKEYKHRILGGSYSARFNVLKSRSHRWASRGSGRGLVQSQNLRVFGLGSFALNLEGWSPCAVS